MTCKDCVHYEVCRSSDNEPFDECNHFKPKSRFVELPCEVGQTVHYIAFRKIYESKVAEITVVPFEKVKFEMHCYGGMCYDLRDLGKTVFLSREEAEKALKEREANDS